MKKSSFDGKMMFSRRDLVRLIVPLIVEQLLSVTVGTADTMMISAVGEAAVSGISLVDTVNCLIIFIMSGLATGGAVVISQYLGMREDEKACHASKQLLYGMMVLSLTLSVLSFSLRRPILTLLYPSVDPAVMENALIYFKITSVSFPFLAMFNACTAIFRSMGNSRYSMLTSMAMNIINIGGNAFLIYACGWGAAGAATATLVSRMTAALLMLMLVTKKKHRVHVERLFSPEPDAAMLSAILRVGVPNGLESGIFHIGKLIVQRLLAGLGTPSIAANAILNALINFMIVPGSAMGMAIVTVTGQCVGAGAYDQARYYIRRIMAVVYAFLIAIGGALYLFRYPLFSLFTFSDEAFAIALRLLPGLVLSHMTVWPIAFPFANFLRASGDVRFTMITSVVSMWVLRIGMAYVFIRLLGFGLEGVWYAMYIDWILRAALFYYRYRSGKWQYQRVIRDT